MGLQRIWKRSVAPLNALVGVLTGLAANAAMAEPAQWPSFLTFVPWRPWPTTLALAAATVVLAVVDATRVRPRYLWHRVVNIALAIATPLIASLAGLAGGAANTDQWPASFDWIAITPTTACLVLLAMGVVLAGVGSWWDTRIDLTGLFITPAQATLPASLLRADLHTVPFRGPPTLHRLSPTSSPQTPQPPW